MIILSDQQHLLKIMKYGSIKIWSKLINDSGFQKFDNIQLWDLVCFMDDRDNISIKMSIK